MLPRARARLAQSVQGGGFSTMLLFSLLWHSHSLLPVTAQSPGSIGLSSAYVASSAGGVTLGPTAWTLETFFFATAAPATVWTPIISLASSSSGGGELRLAQNVQGGGFGMVLSCAAGSATGASTCCTDGPCGTACGSCVSGSCSCPCNSVGDVYYNTGVALPTGVWHHLAITCTPSGTTSSTVRLWLNGALNITATLPLVHTYSAAAVYLGADPYSADGRVSGLYTSVRAVAGVAVYTGAFAPPAAPLALTQAAGVNTAAIAGGQTVLLLSAASAAALLTDSAGSVTLAAVANGGTPWFSSAVPWPASASASASPSPSATASAICRAYTFLGSALASQGAARSACQALGAGWDLASIPDAAAAASAVPAGSAGCGGQNSGNAEQWLGLVDLGVGSGPTTYNPGYANGGRTTYAGWAFTDGASTSFLQGTTAGQALWDTNEPVADATQLCVTSKSTGLKNAPCGANTVAACCMRSGCSTSPSPSPSASPSASPSPSATASFSACSVYFDGSSAIASAGTTAFTALGSAPYTLELFVKLTAAAANAWTTILSIGQVNLGNEIRLGQNIGNSGKTGLLLPSTTCAAGVGSCAGCTANCEPCSTCTGSNLNSAYFNVPITVAPQPLSLNMWHHLALVRSGAAHTLYVDGKAFLNASATYSAAAGAVYLGSNPFCCDGYLQGYFTNVRLTTGVALYSGASFALLAGPLGAAQAAGVNISAASSAQIPLLLSMTAPAGTGQANSGSGSISMSVITGTPRGSTDCPWAPTGSASPSVSASASASASPSASPTVSASPFCYAQLPQNTVCMQDLGPWAGTPWSAFPAQPTTLRGCQAICDSIFATYNCAIILYSPYEAWAGGPACWFYPLSAATEPDRSNTKAYCTPGVGAPASWIAAVNGCRSSTPSPSASATGSASRSPSPSASPTASPSSPCTPYQPPAVWGGAAPLPPWKRVTATLMNTYVTIDGLQFTSADNSNATVGGYQLTPAMSVACANPGALITAFAYTEYSGSSYPYPTKSGLQSMGPWRCDDGSTITTVLVANPTCCNGASAALPAGRVCLPSPSPSPSPSNSPSASASASTSASPSLAPSAPPRGSVYFNGASSAASNITAFPALGSGQFTIEGWAKLTAAAGSWTPILTVGTAGGWEIRIMQSIYGSSGVFGVMLPSATCAAGVGSCGGCAGGAGGSCETASSTSIAFFSTPLSGSARALSLNIWHHIALVRSGSSAHTLYVDGAAYLSASSTYTLPQCALYLATNAVGDGPSRGFISNVRVVSGLAVYGGASFSPPAAPFAIVTAAAPNVSAVTAAQTVLLLSTATAATALANSGSASSAMLAVRTGTPVFSADSPWTPPAAGSVYLGGSAAAISTGTPALTAFGAAPYTVEFWVKLTAAAPSGWAPIVSIGLNDGYEIRFTQSMGGSGTFGMVMPASSCAGSSCLGCYGGISCNARPGINQAFFNVPISGGAPAALSLNVWHHIALVRAGGTAHTLYVDGAAYLGMALSYSLPAGYFMLGANPYGPGDGYATGYFSNVRVVSGLAVYSGASFPPPAAPFLTASPAGPNTSAVSAAQTVLLLSTDTAATVLSSSGSGSVSFSTSNIGTPVFSADSPWASSSVSPSASASPSASPSPTVTVVALPVAAAAAAGTACLAQPYRATVTLGRYIAGAYAPFDTCAVYTNIGATSPVWCAWRWGGGGLPLFCRRSLPPPPPAARE